MRMEALHHIEMIQKQKKVWYSINILLVDSSEKEIGHYHLTPNFKNSRESFTQDGSNLMRLINFLIMELFS